MRHDEAEAGRVEAELGRVIAEEDRVDAEAGEGGAALELGRVQAEEARVEAERLREERENRRRIAEGGPDQHVPGNTMLHGRVEAEKEREATLRQWMIKYAMVIAMVVALVSLIPSLFGITLLYREIDQRCVDSKVNRDAIRESIIEGLPTLGYRYVPETDRIVKGGKPLDYYATHPEERNDALERSKRQLARFPTIKCE